MRVYFIKSMSQYPKEVGLFLATKKIQKMKKTADTSQYPKEVGLFLEPVFISISELFSNANYLQKQTQYSSKA